MSKKKKPRELLDEFVSRLAKFDDIDLSEIVYAIVPLLPRETVYVVPEYSWTCPYCTNFHDGIHELDDVQCAECGLMVSLEHA